MIKIPDGFPQQRLTRISLDLRQRLRQLPVAKHLYLTDIGHFPQTKHHWIQRDKGLKEHVLIFCVSGKGYVSFNHRKFELQTSQAILIPSGTPHRYSANTATPWNIFWIHFTGEQASDYRQLLMPHPSNPILQISDADEVIQHFERMYSLANSAYTGTALIDTSIALSQFLGALNRLRTSKHRRSRKSEERIQDSMEYILKHYPEIQSLETLAHKAGLSIPHYVALFRKHTGKSPIAYLIGVRIRHACERLELTSMPVSEIASAVGYEDPFYFSRTFRKQTGLSPSRYRNLQQRSISTTE